MLDVLYNIFVAPLMQLCGWLFEYPASLFDEGGTIIAFSVLLNVLLLPLYQQMERKSRSGVVLRERVARDVARMKRYFRGRERYYYVRAVHRQHGYRPLSQLLGSADLFLQVLVFATVYRYLSNLGALAGASFGPLHDLSKPDGLLGGINVLPFIMTLVNVAAVFAYVEDRSRRVQALVLAAIFLFLLYGSASGLVLYWTTNNLFSLVRTLIRKLLAGRPGGNLVERFVELQKQQ